MLDRPLGRGLQVELVLAARSVSVIAKAGLRSTCFSRVVKLTTTRLRDFPFDFRNWSAGVFTLADFTGFSWFSFSFVCLLYL